jgi:hypothetical protein
MTLASPPKGENVKILTCPLQRAFTRNFYRNPKNCMFKNPKIQFLDKKIKREGYLISYSNTSRIINKTAPTPLKNYKGIWF